VEVSSNLQAVSRFLDDLQEEAALLTEFYESVVVAEPPVPEERITEMILRMGPRSRHLERVALTDLLNSGGLQYLDHPEMRRALSRYERALLAAEDRLDGYARFWESEVRRSCPTAPPVRGVPLSAQSRSRLGFTTRDRHGRPAGPVGR
jgi:hypothetical protein